MNDSNAASAKEVLNAHKACAIALISLTGAIKGQAIGRDMREVYQQPNLWDMIVLAQQDASILYKCVLASVHANNHG